MNKSILALAVAAALATPLAVQADTILYGSARASLDYTNEKPAKGYWDIVNNDSRLGVLGAEDLGGGLSAVYQYEFGVDLTEGGNFESNRPKFVGLKGGFGTLTLGTQETPYYHVAGVTDIFNTSKSFGETAWLGGSFNGFLRPTDSSGRTAGSLAREANSLYYLTPDFGGFSAEAMLVVDGSRNKASGTDTGYSNSVDLWNVALKYSNGPFFAGVSYIALQGDKDIVLIYPDGTRLPATFDLDQWAVGLGYQSGPFSLGLTYERGDLNTWGPFKPIFQAIPGSSVDTPWNAYLAASYSFGNNIIRAAYGQLGTGVNFTLAGTRYRSKIDNYLVGYQYNFTKRTSVWAEYVGRNSDALFLHGDQNAVSIGTRVDF